MKSYSLALLLALGVSAFAAGKSDSYAAKGMQFHKQYKLDSALFYFAEADKAGLADPAYRLMWAEDLIVSKAPAKAIAVMDNTVLKGSNETQKMEWTEYLATLYSWTGEYNKSMNLFKQVLNSPVAQATTKLRVRLRMAEVLSWQKDFNRALKALDLILSEYPKSIEAYLIKGQIFEWKGEYIAAKKLYTLALQVSPDHGVLKSRLEKLAWVN